MLVLWLSYHYNASSIFLILWILLKKKKKHFWFQQICQIMPLEKYFSSLNILLLLFTQICNLTWIVREGHLSSFQLYCSKLALSLRCSMREVSKGFPAELFDPPAISNCQDWTLSRLTMLVKQQLIPELSRIFRSWILCWYIVFRNMGAASWFMFLLFHEIKL